MDVLVFKVEILTGKKIDQSHVELVSQQNKFESSLFSVLFTFANKEIVRD